MTARQHSEPGPNNEPEARLILLDGRHTRADLVRTRAALTTRSIEGVPDEVVSYASAVIERHVCSAWRIEMSVLDAGSEGAWAHLEIRDGIAYGMVCVTFETHGCWSEGKWEPWGERPAWMSTFPRNGQGIRSGWAVRDNWVAERQLGPIADNRAMRSALVEVLNCAHSTFGLVAPWTWRMAIGLEPWGAMADLSSSAYGVPVAGRRPLIAGCTEAGYCFHRDGACELHTPCDMLIGCGTSHPKVAGVCDGCAGIGALLTNPYKGRGG